MTQPEFFAYVQKYPNQLNIWYDDVAPPYTVKAVSVPVLDNTLQDISNYLTLVQQLIIPLPQGGSVTVNILSRQLVTGTVGGVTISCYYFEIAHQIISTLSEISESNANIQLFPAIDQTTFYDSPYNTIQGTIEGVRPSTFIMESDRYKVGTLANPTYTGPLNIDLLLSGSASLATVQDSNYTTTGWINGRYEGSKTDRTSYKTEPSIAGTLFQGAEFPSGSTLTQVQYLQTNNQVVYKELFFAGSGNTPGYYPINSGFIYTGSGALGILDTLMYITPDSTNIIPTPKVGTLIKLDSEIMRIQAVGFNPTDYALYSLIVTRGVNSTTATHSNKKAVENVSQVQIYNITGNKLTGVPRGKVLVQDTGALLTLDNLGYVVTSSFTSA